MIQVQTLLKVADNSGGKVVRCLKILKKGTKPRYGKIGDVIVVSVQKIRSKNKLTSKVKKGDTLVILEAMKMEHQVKASDDGKVTKVLVKKDDQLENGAVLMVIDK